MGLFTRAVDHHFCHGLYTHHFLHLDLAAFCHSQNGLFPIPGSYARGMLGDPGNQKKTGKKCHRHPHIHVGHDADGVGSLRRQLG